MVVDALVGIGIRFAAAARILGTVISVNGTLPGEAVGHGERSVGQAQRNAGSGNVELVDPLPHLIDRIRVEIKVSADVDLLEKVGGGRYTHVLHLQ